MTVQEIVMLGSVETRKSTEALARYKQLFFEAFGRTPDCPSCGSSLGVADWTAFEALAKGETIEDIKLKYMNMRQEDLEKTFVVYASYDLVTYVEERDGRKFVERSYVNSMSEQFANNFLTNVVDEAEFAERSKYFAVLPIKFRDGIAEAEAILESIETDEPETVDELSEQEKKDALNAKRREAYKNKKK